jgi:UPF0716 protein FxsA
VAVLALLFLVVPFIELYVLIQVGHAIGAPETILLLIAVSMVGAWLVKREGLATLERVRRRVDAGEVPGRELVDGLLVLLAGVLLITPGFLSDVVGILLLLPPVRAVVRASAVRLFARRAELSVSRRQW